MFWKIVVIQAKHSFPDEHCIFFMYLYLFIFVLTLYSSWGSSKHFKPLHTNLALKSLLSLWITEGKATKVFLFFHLLHDTMSTTLHICMVICQILFLSTGGEMTFNSTLFWTKNNILCCCTETYKCIATVLPFITLKTPPPTL